jgi:uncharacterized protein YqcC (DUF446 family)
MRDGDRHHFRWTEPWVYISGNIYIYYIYIPRTVLAILATAAVPNNDMAVWSSPIAEQSNKYNQVSVQEVLTRLLDVA